MKDIVGGINKKIRYCKERKISHLEDRAIETIPKEKEKKMKKKA